MMRTITPAAVSLAPGLPLCGQLLQRLAAALQASGSAATDTSAAAALAQPLASTASFATTATTATPSPAPVLASSGATLPSGSPSSGSSIPCSGSSSGSSAAHRSASASSRSHSSSGRGSWRGGRGGDRGGWRWGRQGQRHGGSGGSGTRWGPASAAAAGAAAATFAASGLVVANAEAPKHQGSLHDAAVAAQQALSSAWGQVEEDLARLNARLPSSSPTVQGEAPSASVIHDAVEVVVPIREGADPEAVLAAMRKGLAGKGSVTYNESVYGASRTVRLEVRPDSSHPETFVRMQMFVPPPGGSEQAQAVISKRGAFTPEELAALSRVVHAANLTTAADRPAHGASARRHGLHGGLGPDDLNHQLEQLFEDLERGAGPLGALFAGPLRQMFEELHRGLGPQEGREGGNGGFGGTFGGSFGGGSGSFNGGAGGFGDGPRSGGFEGWQPPQLPPPSQQPQQPGDVVQRPRRGGAGAAADGHDWGSPAAQRAVEYLMSIGAQVFPPGNKEEMDWGVLAGYDEQKRTIEDCLLLPLLRPDVYSKLARATRKTPANIRPRAVLFEGPPGTGKTTSARVISSQAAVPLIYLPLESILSKWYGESEQQLGQVFKAAEAMGGAIIFLDELDALGGNRSAGGLHEVSRRLLSVLLREMEGFDAETKRTVVIGATNRKADLDPALLSRFDLVLTFGLPDTTCRQLILRQYARQLSDPELTQLADRTPGMSGRDLRDVCEHTERRWASKIIRGEVKDEELPPLSEYLASAQERATAVQQVQRQADSAGALDRLLEAAGGGGGDRSLPSWLSGFGR